MTKSHRTFGLLGFPLGHSFSRRYFTEKFSNECVDAEYVNFEFDSIDRLPEIFSNYPDICGFNVTIPYKEQILDRLDDIDDTARTIGAVNTVKVYHEHTGRLCLKGYNTDIIGFSDSILPMLTPDCRSALVLGTGGASKAVIAGLRRLGVEPVPVSRRDVDGGFTYAALTPEIVKDHKVIVNTTPLGMFPDIDSCPDIPYEGVGAGHVCYDLVYNPEITAFMKRCKDAGAVVKCGLEMLHGQAEAAWRIWNDDNC